MQGAAHDVSHLVRYRRFQKSLAVLDKQQRIVTYDGFRPATETDHAGGLAFEIETDFNPRHRPGKVLFGPV